MKILFYNTKPYELNYLQAANQHHYEVKFTTKILSIKTVKEAVGFNAISIFVDDDASELVLIALHKVGVKYIAIRAAGYNNIATATANKLNIIVANAPKYSPYAIAEHTVTLLLALNRKIIIGNRQMMQNNFTLNQLIGADIHNKTVGIIGVGKIGSVVAKIMHGFGCKLLGFDIHKNYTLVHQYHLKYVDITTLCKHSDIICIHTNLTEQTKYIINKNTIAFMRPNVIIINTSRGACVNTDDIIEALEHNTIAAFGADVYENEKGIFFNDLSKKPLQDVRLLKLLNHPNVMITPHQAFATKEALQNIASTTLYNLECWSNNKHSINEIKK